MSTYVTRYGQIAAEQIGSLLLNLDADQIGLVNDEVIDLIDSGDGVDISFNDTTHRAMLEAGKKYHLICLSRINPVASTNFLSLKWYDFTNGMYLSPGVRSISFSLNLAALNSSQPMCFASVTPATDIEVELRCSAQSGNPGVYGTANSFVAWIEQVSQ